MILIENWKKAWKWFSVQVLALAGALSVSWPLIPDEIRAQVPVNITTIIAVLCVLGIILRVINQGGKADD